MKIAIIHDCIYPFRKGGGEVRNYHLSRQLAKMGHEVFLAVSYTHLTLPTIYSV